MKNLSVHSNQSNKQRYENIKLRLLWMKEMQNQDSISFSMRSKKISTYL